MISIQEILDPLAAVDVRLIVVGQGHEADGGLARVRKKDDYATNAPSAVPSTCPNASSVSSSTCTSDWRVRWK
jgi:hypothetical protein